MRMASPLRAVLLVGCVCFGSAAHAVSDAWLKAAGDCAKHSSPDARLECEAKQKAAMQAFKKQQDLGSAEPNTPPTPAPPKDLCFTVPQTGERMCPN
jgi:hypothetical protein